MKKYLLIVDLDETLIHTAYYRIAGGNLKSQRGLFSLYERPHLRGFLDRCSNDYDLAIWSASKADYVRWIIRVTVLVEYDFVFIKTRKHCKRIFSKHGNVEYQKDITPFLSQYEKVIILDDFPKMVNPTECCLKAPEYRGGVDDFLLNNCPDKLNDIQTK
jgi:TFIIF-interacting CTD phosphatase-like protein